MAHIFFSIVIVSLNPGKKLAKTVKSVLRQEYGNFEIIIKDGGSTDGSLPEDVPAEGACLAADSRVRIFRGPDRGIYDGMNQALPEINGDYVLFLNCGDSLYDPLVLARTAELIEEAEAGRDSRLRAKAVVSDSIVMACSGGMRRAWPRTGRGRTGGAACGGSVIGKGQARVAVMTSQMCSTSAALRPGCMGRVTSSP